MPTPGTPTTPTPTDKVTVLIRCGISFLGDIDVIRQQFTCELWMTASWREPKLAGKKNEEVKWDNEWSPKISFSNSLLLDRVYKGRRLYYEENSTVPLAQEVYKIRGTFKEQFSLEQFPVDLQELSIIISSDWSDRTVTFEKDMAKPDYLRQQTFSSPRDWVLYPHVHTDTATQEGEGLGPNDRSYPVYIITAHVRRRAVHYFWNTAVVMSVLTALSFASFAIPPQQTADRLTVTLLLLLISVAYKFVTSLHLPRTSYLTFLDKYQLGNLLFISFIAVLNTIAVAVESRDTYDMVCLYAGLALYVILQCMAGILTLHKHYVVNGELKKFTRKYEIRNDEIERLRRERDWYAERSKQPKTPAPSIILTPVSRLPKFSANGYSPARQGAPLASPDDTLGISNKSYV
ncbi:predicted protein [Nematostella vectensis]|uniref:Uncharacterized protein n=1 Tax=Nematostella vectensis TaxID=45351 RepID=A7SU26_NEMVE|nr:predicted protein [Nematostella vectensis]|eukprot:XP_001624890.1 predicted protein [Nematostella vectensis]